MQYGGWKKSGLSWFYVSYSLQTEPLGSGTLYQFCLGIEKYLLKGWIIIP